MEKGLQKLGTQGFEAAGEKDTTALARSSILSSPQLFRKCHVTSNVLYIIFGMFSPLQHL